jgi:hypothetical protein
MLPLSDVPHYERVFLVHASDGGESWAAPDRGRVRAGQCLR